MASHCIRPRRTRPCRIATCLRSHCHARTGACQKKTGFWRLHLKCADLADVWLPLPSQTGGTIGGAAPTAEEKNVWFSIGGMSTFRQGLLRIQEVRIDSRRRGKGQSNRSNDNLRISESLSIRNLPPRAHHHQVRGQFPQPAQTNSP